MSEPSATGSGGIEGRRAPRVLVAVIAYNEQESLPGVVEELRRDCDYDIVVIDNASTDGTVAVCRSLGVDYVAHCTNTGGSMGTVKTYFQYAYQGGYDVLCQFDGDGQHVASFLPRIVDPVAEDRADYVIGSRFLDRQGFQSSAVRRIGIRTFSGLTSWLMGQHITDVTSGFRAYGRSVIELFARHYRHELYDTAQLMLLSHYAECAHPGGARRDAGPDAGAVGVYSAQGLALSVRRDLQHRRLPPAASSSRAGEDRATAARVMSPRGAAAGESMGPRVAAFAALVGVVFFVFVVRSVRTSSIRPTFALLWLGIAAFLLSIPVLEPLYKWISVTVVGIEDARHIIYIPLIGFLLVYSFYMTIAFSKLSDRMQAMITHVAILENRLRSSDP